MSLIEVKNLNKSFDLGGESSEVVLRDIAFSIKQGSLTLLYGPSGCGKSTLLNLLSGLDRTYDGTISFNGTHLKDMNESEMINFRKEHIGFVFQNFNLIPHMTVLENVLVSTYVNDRSPSENKKKAIELLTQVGLEDHLNKNVTQLSGGQKQRVAIARALVNDPEVIFADEPTGALDSQSQEMIMDIFADIVKKGKTVIIVTHNEEIEPYADHIIKLRDGKVIGDEENNKVSDQADTLLQLKKGKSFSWRSAAKLAYANLMQRRWRNFMIMLATSIGITGIVIALGLGNGIVQLINSDANDGKMPSQIQVSLNQEKPGVPLNDQDVVDIKEKVGADKIQYIEAPFSIIMNKVEIADKGKLDFSENMPNYAQVVSLFKETDITVAVNTKDEVLAGDLYTDPNEKGITITETMLKDFNNANGTNLSAKEVINQPIKLQIMSSDQKNPQTIQVETTIKRVLKDDLGESNSHLSMSELEEIINQNHLQKMIPYIIVQLKDSQGNEEAITAITKNQRYIAFAQTEMLNMIIRFIKIIQGLLVALSTQAIVVSIVMIGVIIYINIMERTREIGVMKAVGYHNRAIGSIFTFEALYIALFSVVISLVVSGSLGYIANKVISMKYPSIAYVFLLDWRIIVGTILLAIAIAYIASAFPVRKVAQLDAAQSLRYE